MRTFRITDNDLSHMEAVPTTPMQFPLSDGQYRTLEAQCVVLKRLPVAVFEVQGATLELWGLVIDRWRDIDHLRELSLYFGDKKSDFKGYFTIEVQNLGLYDPKPIFYML